MHLEFGIVVQGPVARLVIDEGNRVQRFPNILRGEQIVHGGVGKEHAQVKVIILPMADALQNSDHLEAHAVQQDVAAHGLLMRKRMRRASSPITSTGSFCASSSRLSQRPAAMGR